MKQTYWDKLKDSRWQKRRSEIMTRDGFKCWSCESTTKQLTVHHEYYVSGRDPWEYPDFCLKTLCWDCHKARHSEVELERLENPDRFPPHEWESALDFVNDGMPDDGKFWDVACAIGLALSDGVDRDDLLERVTKFVHGIRGSESCDPTV